MKIFRNILILTGLVAFATYIVVSVWLVSPLMDETVCEHIDICVTDTNVRRFISTKDVAEQLGRTHQKYMGMPFRKIDFQAIENEVLRNPFVRKVECYSTPNGALRIDVEQRRPCFRVMTPDGNYYVDNDRRRMPTSTRFSVLVPVVTGVAPDEFIVGPLFDFIADLQDDDFWSNQVTQINVRPNGHVELVPRIGNHTIVLGDLENVDAKLDKMMTFYRKCMPHVGWNRYSVIDLRYKNQVVCTKWPDNQD